MAFFDDLGGLAQAGAGIAGLFGGNEQDKVAKKTYKLAKSEYDWNHMLAQALAGRKPEFIQPLIDQSMAEQKSSLAAAIRALRAQQWQAELRGVPGPLVNPERQDESVAKMYSQLFDTARTNAQNEARAYLTSAANVNSGAAQASLPYMQPYGAATQAQRASGIGAAGDLASYLGNTLMPYINGGSQPSNAGGSIGGASGNPQVSRAGF